ncbi:hypothetical protein [Anaeromyxobacter oryzae]|uniref:DUF5666 domain-containing protein n=1 Tax=Anaeromyxobacter oryzae TaxID=2918170 RepID=A0ABN6N0K2_9BACT|nr:hypothetical protein [Anaeromyxobacter oryzae]BDG06716.1 hypothetical protein AMOR_57120 [Anaeromyxobacter oryzae]
MKQRIALALLLGALASPALAAPKTYQVTGPVVDVTDDTITVQKGNEKWEIARTAETKVTGELKKGEKVTVEYRMSATSIEVKAAKASSAKAKK